MCSAAHVQANNISRGWVYPALCDSPLTSVAALVWTTCKHTTPRSPDFMPALKHSWTLFSSTLSTATPLTQLLSSRTSHAAYFFLSLCSESCWAGVISVAFFEAESLFFFILFCPCLMCAQGTYGRIIFPLFFLLLPAFAPLCSFFLPLHVQQSDWPLPNNFFEYAPAFHAFSL